MSAADKLQGTCAVCLRPMQLHGDAPIRHGFAAIGVRHGAHSGYHTGPCRGTTFPNLGVSDEGTRWALGDAQSRLERVEARLAELAAFPDLTWFPRLSGSFNRVRGGLPDTDRPVVLKHGDGSAWNSDGRPTYAYEHKRRVEEQQWIKRELDRAIAEYERVLATWAPGKYPVTGAKKKVDTVHLAKDYPARLGRSEYTGIQCRFLRNALLATRASKTTDPSKVTCKPCRKSLGLPPL